MRHLFLITDIEGAAGVTSWLQTRVPGPELDAARRLLTDEVNAFCQGAFDASQTHPEPLRISVWDGHGYGGLDLAAIDARCAPYPHDFPGGITHLFREGLATHPPMDAIAFLGQHAMEGSGGNLSHTYSSRRIKHHRLNGIPIGEFGTRCLHAWSLGVPTVFLSGDDVACQEARDLVAGIDTLAVKKSLGLVRADSLDPAESQGLLREAGARCVGADLDAAEWAPRLDLSAPYVYSVEYKLKWGLIPKPTRRIQADELLTVLSQV